MVHDPAIMSATTVSDTDRKRERRLITPEGAYLTLRLASPGDRLGAAMIDFFVVTFGTVAVVLAVFTIFQISPSARNYSSAVALLASFIFRLFYYPALEFAWRGRTVGKRLMNLRVIDRRGGVLKPEAIIARNFLREIELWMPLSGLLALQGNRGDGLADLFSVGWLLVLSAFPLFTKDVTRLGDLVAGTWVVYSPAAELLPDLTQIATAERLVLPGSEFRFTKDQLDPYGEYELEVLAKVLRDKTPAAQTVLPEVASRIQKKIGWQSRTDGDPRAFLLAYYKALRGQLEAKLIFGKRKLNKYNID